MTTSTRTPTILERFPRHLEADQPGKLFGTVVDALAGELDVKTTQLGRIRESHRLAEASERDLLLHASLHGLRQQDFEILSERLAAAGSLRRKLTKGAGEGADAVKSLKDALGLLPDTFVAWPGDGQDQGPLHRALESSLAVLGSYESVLDLLRACLRTVIHLHRTGNGTVGAILGAAAAHLQLDLEKLGHSDDRFWHGARCRDRLRLALPGAPGSGLASTAALPSPDLLALEENPLRSREVAPQPRRHGERFRVVMGGLEPVPMTVIVKGVGRSTAFPMVVNLDSGLGLAYTGQVPDGKELRFAGDGRSTTVMLDGTSVASFSYLFRAAVFADKVSAHANDFVFADADRPLRFGSRAGKFSQSTPKTPDAFGPWAWGGYSHWMDPLEGSPMDRGESRWAFFVGVAAFGGQAPAGEALLANPRSHAGVFDHSLFDWPPEPDPSPAGEVGFAWQEREPFAMVLWIPQRFSVLDHPGRLAVSERLQALLDRHRAAGVQLGVRYAGPGFEPPKGIVAVGSDALPGRGEGPEAAGRANFELADAGRS